MENDDVDMKSRCADTRRWSPARICFFWGIMLSYLHKDVSRAGGILLPEVRNDSWREILDTAEALRLSLPFYARGGTAEKANDHDSYYLLLRKCPIVIVGAIFMADWKRAIGAAENRISGPRGVRAPSGIMNREWALKTN